MAKGEERDRGEGERFEVGKRGEVRFGLEELVCAQVVR